jgi:hypothetical protein
VKPRSSGCSGCRPGIPLVARSVFPSISSIWPSGGHENRTRRANVGFRCRKPRDTAIEVLCISNSAPNPLGGGPLACHVPTDILVIGHCALDHQRILRCIAIDLREVAEATRPPDAGEHRAPRQRHRSARTRRSTLARDSSASDASGSRSVPACRREPLDPATSRLHPANPSTTHAGMGWRDGGTVGVYPIAREQAAYADRIQFCIQSSGICVSKRQRITARNRLLFRCFGCFSAPAVKHIFRTVDPEVAGSNPVALADKPRSPRRDGVSCCADRMAA